MSNLIGPGSTIGILGAGQLGRMLASVARRMGYRIAVFGGDDSSPTGQLSDLSWPGNYDDADALAEFARAADVVTYEFENIPAHAAARIAEVTPLCPGAALLTAAQNRFKEKTALTSIGLPVAPFRMVHSGDELAAARAEFGDCILKANTDGYDGKGQWSVSDETDVVALWEETGIPEAVVEKKVSFDFELSAIGGRYRDGQKAFYAPFLNHHENHILDVTISAATQVTPELEKRATEMAAAVLDHFEVIGVLCIELFLTTDGQLIVNEIAPRPHNSGHLTIEAYNCSQFELQLRTICNLPSVDLERTAPASAMANLLGQHLPSEWTTDAFSCVGTQPNLHLYGKAGAKTNRKMGHLTITADSPDEAERSVRKTRDQLTA